MWYSNYKLAQTQIYMDPKEVKKVYDNFISHSGSGLPQFVKDVDGITRLLVHGSQGQDGKIYFYIGENFTSGDGTQYNNYLPQDKMGEWITSKGFSPATRIIGCYSALASNNITPETSRATGKLEIGVPEGADSNFITIYD